MEDFRLGLIGCGGMMKAHVNCLNLVEGVKVTAVCDIIEERAIDVASVCDNAYVTTDYKTMCDYVDGVLVVLPHDLHFECGMFFAGQKKHILMEKPMCNSEAECLKLIETCEDMGVTLMCAYPVRYWPSIILLKEMLDSGEYGKPIMMSIWTEQLTKADPTDWKGTARLGGGQLFSHGCHYIDLLLWFLGNPVSGTHLGTQVGTPWMMEEGTSAVTMKFENGAIGYHGATWGARGSRLYYDFQIQCEKGMIEYDHKAGEVRVYDHNKEHVPGETIEERGERVVWDRRNAPPNKNTECEMRHFLECCRTGKKPMTDGRTSLQGLRVIWKLYEAEKQGVVADLRGLGIENA